MPIKKNPREIVFLVKTHLFHKKRDNVHFHKDIKNVNNNTILLLPNN